MSSGTESGEISSEDGNVSVVSDNISSGSGGILESGSSEDEVSGVGRPTLPVATFTDTFTPSSTPTNGPEYLAQVRLERSRLPRISTTVSMSESGKVVLDDEEGGEQPVKAPRLDTISPIVTVEKERASRILAEFIKDKANADQSDSENACLKKIAAAVKSSDHAQAYSLLLCLDNRLTSNQTSLLRSIVKESGDERLLVIAARHFGQSDLVRIV
jgi:hypothetical protein